MTRTDGTVPPLGRVIVRVDEAQQARMRALQSFSCLHSLGGSPLVDFEAVGVAARRMLRERRLDQILYVTGRPDAIARSRDDVRPEELLATLDGLASERAWIRLTRVDEVIPELRDVIHRFYADLSELHGFDVAPRVYKTLPTLFVSSPGVVTPYHMDHTWNYLLQIRGSKTMYVFDPKDERVMNDRMRERFYVGQRQIERDPAAGEGVAYTMTPGACVHNPVNAPHWVQNGPECSVSLSLGLALHESNRLAKVHQVNYLLRRFGIEPASPGRSAVRDALKASLMQAFSDRHPESFDDILYSGYRRLHALAQGSFFRRRGPRPYTLEA